MVAKKVSLKLFMIEKGSQRRVLFAEADKEFVDFLFSIFTLPVGTVTRLLKEGSGMVGSLPTLYRSIENMSFNHIQPAKDKSFLLEPKVFMPGVKIPLLLPNVASTFRQLYNSDDDNTKCYSCGARKNALATFTDPPSATRAFSTSEEGYVRGTITYMVMDDLDVKISSASSFATLLTQFDVNDIRVIEEKVVDVGMDEGVKLLRTSLQSKTVLTDVFLSAEIIQTEVSIKEEEHVEI
ncbi:uncharacterized protein LOC132188076 [Corylus avellana]|uniref:uncharacterized protein LOC132188076 n=1 Tax=Corylus avellana TaxID=13451 RepID=UPI00286CA11A|nr:uncharacterized protein LOC132188076 [Corylus avellana]